MSSAGEVADHRLEIQQRFEAALRDLGLVRRVLRVPAGIFEDVALNHRRRDAVVVAHADERAEDLVLRRDGFQFAQRVEFTLCRRKIERFAKTDLFRHGGVGQGIERIEADHLQHFRGFGRVRTDVAADKLVRML